MSPISNKFFTRIKTSSKYCMFITLKIKSFTIQGDLKSKGNPRYKLSSVYYFNLNAKMLYEQQLQYILILLIPFQILMASYWICLFSFCKLRFLSSITEKPT